jgi:hypothetical protein
MSSTTSDDSTFKVGLNLVKAKATYKIFKNSNSPVASWATTCFSFVAALPHPICLPPSRRVAPWSSLGNSDSFVRSTLTPNDSRTYSRAAYTMIYCWSANPIDCKPTAKPNFSSRRLATMSGSWSLLTKLFQILHLFLRMSFNWAKLFF